MLYIQEKIVKLGGAYLGGQVTSVEVQEAGSIYVAQDEKGRSKKAQPVGYENAKVMIDILFEDSSTASALDQLAEMQALFRASGQDVPRLLTIVNEECAACGISQVYFKNLSCKKNVSESMLIASLELLAPDTAEIKVVKKTDAKTAAEQADTESKSTKSKAKSPAVDSRDAAKEIKAAGRIVCGKKARSEIQKAPVPSVPGHSRGL